MSVRTKTLKTDGKARTGPGLSSNTSARATSNRLADSPVAVHDWVRGRRDVDAPECRSRNLDGLMQQRWKGDAPTDGTAPRGGSRDSRPWLARGQHVPLQGG